MQKNTISKIKNRINSDSEGEEYFDNEISILNEKEFDEI